MGGSIDVDALVSTIVTARKSGVYARALCIINPGNPTGQVLGKSEMEAVVRVCEEYRLVLLADEVRTRRPPSLIHGQFHQPEHGLPGLDGWIAQVYMSNIAPGGKPFLSFKRIVRETSSEVELASFHSCSKGVVGECGLRAGCASSCSHLCAAFPEV